MGEGRFDVVDFPGKVLGVEEGCVHTLASLGLSGLLAFGRIRVSGYLLCVRCVCGSSLRP